MLIINKDESTHLKKEKYWIKNFYKLEMIHISEEQSFKITHIKISG